MNALITNSSYKMLRSVFIFYYKLNMDVNNNQDFFFSSKI
jgi:hypothetical protein